MNMQLNSSFNWTLSALVFIFQWFSCRPALKVLYSTRTAVFGLNIRGVNRAGQNAVRAGPGSGQFFYPGWAGPNDFLIR